MGFVLIGYWFALLFFLSQDICAVFLYFAEAGTFGGIMYPTQVTALSGDTMAGHVLFPLDT